jgi:hypothetical protein
MIVAKRPTRTIISRPKKNCLLKRSIELLPGDPIVNKTECYIICKKKLCKIMTDGENHATN